MIAKRLAMVVTLFYMILGSAWASASWEEAGKVVEEATINIFQLLQNEALLQEENEEQLIHEIDIMLSPIVDFPYMAKGVMGKYYRRASQEERERFAEVFKTTLLKTYAKTVVNFNIVEYAMVTPHKVSPDPKKQIVTVNVFADTGEKYSIIYYMKKRSQGWKLVNAILDGSVNVRLSFKNQFADMMQRNRNDVSKVIVSWKEKVDPGKGRT
ncbi:MAG: toluene tolerance protein [Neptuniibacter caesariensis]|uniref:Toluene tolerance protein n=1 Tax=Neptuniibacter caesariensis TaxID=207954 RepID=A0A2G6JN09_NEPCE|nr:MAG: toluene tolerance protein [Neptuniibacter caesariensis]